MHNVAAFPLSTVPAPMNGAPIETILLFLYRITAIDINGTAPPVIVTLACTFSVPGTWVDLWALNTAIAALITSAAAAALGRTET